MEAQNDLVEKLFEISAQTIIYENSRGPVHVVIYISKFISHY